MKKTHAHLQTQPFQPGTLWRRITEQAACARNAGALHSISSRCRYLEDGGIRFAVRILPALALKQALRQVQAEKKQAGQHYNPFLPPERDLSVAAVSDTHLAVLNKFNVLDHHLLIITKHFELQESWLTQADFEALWRCMAEFEGLGFYNAGEMAGASQRHKHLQVVPLPLAPEGPAIPVQTLLKSGAEISTTSLPIPHRIVGLQLDRRKDPAEVVRWMLKSYLQMAAELDVEAHSYNLLVTRKWMLMIPRSRGRFGPISVNSLGFAGSLAVKDDKEFEMVRQTGPWRILMGVSRQDAKGARFTGGID